MDPAESALPGTFRSLRRGFWLAALAALGACGGNVPEQASVPAANEYTGSEVCAGCHAAEAAAWTGSHHFHSMQAATDGNVLGDFNGATGFVQTNTGFAIEADDREGETRQFRVAYTFGYDPLQQYLLELGDGRLQSFTQAWDTRAESEGGQRWFDLHGGEEIDGSDPLHWTRQFYNWNSNCAWCHSTGLDKNYVAEADRYETTYAEVNVGCESCHGPGSAHAAAPTEVALELGPVARAWTLVPGASIAERVPAPDTDSRAELEVCAGCHSRRSQFSGDVATGDPFLDGFRPALLIDPLYHADGQISEEVFVYGSFLQSRMHAAGVTCSDCHEPHSGELRAEGNAVCAQCHLPGTFDTPAHHRHESGATGSFCVDCHMPAETYMVVDPRRDHSFRVPRPDLSVALGTPNACTGCHEETDSWAAGLVADWNPEGHSGTFHYAEALAAGRDWAADRVELLTRVIFDPQQPGIVRATALSLLTRQTDDPALTALRSAVESGEPLLELAAIEALAGLPPEQRVELGQRFLTADTRALRIAAAEALLPARPLLSPRRQADLDAALAELESSHSFNADLPQALTARANLALNLGRPEAAEAALRQAIEREPAFTAAYANLADLYRQLGREADAEQALRSGLAVAPDDAALSHALGLALVRAGRTEEALPALARAAELAPDEPRYGYVYGVALNTLDGMEAALASLEQSRARFPGYADTLVALASFNRDAGNRDEALRYAEMLNAVSPGHAVALALIDQLR